MDLTRSQTLLTNFHAIRTNTVDLTRPLSAEDMVIQSMPDASPSKWHLAHTTWFFEQFILSKWLPHYKSFDPQFNYLFNSYYEAVGARHQRPLRGMLSRPSIDQVWHYRHYVDEHVSHLLDTQSELPPDCLNLIELGLHHEMQHQELLLTDILHALSLHPFAPKILTETPLNEVTSSPNELKFLAHQGGLVNIGNQATEFCYDCESPVHQHFLLPFAIGHRLISNGEWIDFIEDGGYNTASHWLSDGWGHCQQQNWRAPLYWQQLDGEWWQYGFHGLRPVDKSQPVTQISYYEADAFATWYGARLPREQEWETVANSQPVSGNLMESGRWHPSATTAADHVDQLYGDVWEWTMSPFVPYPGFRIASGAVGEYNGKFMSGQYVLKGGSCVTPQQQLRPTYRNFFYPHQRWQFSGLRLAKDL